MLYGTYYINSEKGENILTIFHHSEIKDYTDLPDLFTPAGGLTIRRIKKLIKECKEKGHDYSITPSAALKLRPRGIY